MNGVENRFFDNNNKKANPYLRGDAQRAGGCVGEVAVF
jgi:hypothetical protein